MWNFFKQCTVLNKQKNQINKITIECFYKYNNKVYFIGAFWLYYFQLSKKNKIICTKANHNIIKIDLVKASKNGNYIYFYTHKAQCVFLHSMRASQDSKSNHPFQQWNECMCHTLCSCKLEVIAYPLRWSHIKNTEFILRIYLNTFSPALLFQPILFHFIFLFCFVKLFS